MTSPGRMDDDDHRLSMAISPRAVREEDNERLRTLLIHRLYDSLIAVRRWSLRGNRSSTYCEHCRRWTQHSAAQSSQPTMPAEWACKTCGRLYGIQLIVYGELHQDDGT